MPLPVMVALIGIVVGAVAWFDSRLLADLARTPDYQLRLFERRMWALVIVVSFPIGPMLYLRFAKGGPRPS